MAPMQVDEMVPKARLLDQGKRLHLQHGPIDLIVGADGDTPQERHAAFIRAIERFDGILDELVGELPDLRLPLKAGCSKPFQGVVANRMKKAALAHCHRTFVTPMVAVAGSVADEVLSAMLSTKGLKRAYVNNGGDIAVHIEPGESFSIAIASLHGADLGRVNLTASDGIGGIATSGAGGRSHSFGIADSVTVLADCAASADAAATLICNSVDLKGNCQIERRPACELAPDSDLGKRRVVTNVPPLALPQKQTALRSGQSVANQMIKDNLIKGAALFLQGEFVLCGEGFGKEAMLRELEHV